MTINKTLFTVTALMGIHVSCAAQEAHEAKFKVYVVDEQDIAHVAPEMATTAAAIQKYNETMRIQHLVDHAAPHMQEKDRAVLSQKITLHDIHAAAKEGIIDALTFLLSQDGVIVDQQTENGGYTPLHFAARYGKQEAVKLLLQKQASVTKKSATGNTALHFAAKYFQTATVALLLASNSLVNEKDNNDNTALHGAAVNLDAATIKVLLDAQATLVVNKNGKTPLAVARGSYQELSAFRLDRSKLPQDWNPEQAIKLLEAQAEREAKAAASDRLSA